VSTFSRLTIAAVIHGWLEEYTEAGCTRHGSAAHLPDCEDLAQRIIDEAT
jgi:hypothetical protein